MILSNKQREKIIELFPDESQRLFALPDVNMLLQFLDEVVYSLLDENDDPTDESRIVECLRDEIHWDNVHID